MLRLVDLLEGGLDGDALFFSRDIEIEGDTGAVLALRNAVESEEIVLFEEFAGALGPFGAPVRLVGERGPDAVAAARSALNRLTTLMLGAGHRRGTAP
jgi:predicted lipid carrier protein YhbT